MDRIIKYFQYMISIIPMNPWNNKHSSMSMPAGFARDFRFPVMLWKCCVSGANQNCGGSCGRVYFLGGGSTLLTCSWAAGHTYDMLAPNGRRGRLLQES
jgi:hypothetical protein